MTAGNIATKPYAIAVAVILRLETASMAGAPIPSVRVGMFMRAALGGNSELDALEEKLPEGP
jgi:hypothetical protein